MFNKDVNENQAQFLERVFMTLEESNIDISKENFAFQYKLYKSRNIFSSIVTAVGSLRERNPFVGVRSYAKGKIQYNYFPSRVHGVKAVIIGNIMSGIDRILTADPSHRFEIHSSRGTSDDVKRTRIKSFLREIGVSTEYEFGNQKQLAVGFEALQELKKALNNIQKGQDKRDVIYDEGKFARWLADLNYNIDDAVFPTSYISGSGKKVWMKHNSSFAYEVMRYLQSLVGKGHYQNGPKYLNLPFYQNNIFMKGMNTFHGYIDHDSIKYKGLDVSAKEYRSESSLDWLSRNFNHGFLGFLFSQGTNQNRYVQAMYPVSNKPGLPGVEVDILSFQELDEALQQMLDQQKLLPKLDHVAGYTPDVNYLPGNTVEEIKEYLANLTNEVIDYMLDNNFRYDSRLESAYTKLKTLRGLKPRVKEILESQFNERYSKEVQDSWDAVEAESQ